MVKAIRGFTDEAAQQDLFKIKKYIDGLTTFVENCNTPMTISIQGEWGTGKSSVMQMVNNNLKENGKTHTVWFNTWQFSQFSMEDNLPVSLLQCLLDEFDLPEEQSSKFSKIIKAVGYGAKEFALHYVDHAVGGKTAETVEKAIDTVMGNGEYPNPAKAVKELRTQFAQNVEDVLTKNKKDRLVIFVDDLDRLHPKKAVELLEVLKLFLDCKSCVFVLAIDYDVVCKGVKQKYGADMTEDKGRSFFDKIIQIAFKMPVAEYDIENYVINCFDEIGLPCPKSEIDGYIELIKRSVGTNPRSMKRLFNAYLLLTIVVTEEILEQDKNKQLLFAVLCMQYAFEKVYHYIVEKRDTLTTDILRVLSERAEDGLGDIEITEKEAERIQYFMDKFIEVLKNTDEEDLSDAELNNLKNVLGISTITSSTDNTVSMRSRNEVDSIGDLNIGDKNSDELQNMIDQITKIGPNISYSMRNTKGHLGHVLFKNAKGKSFADIYMRKNGFVIDCIALSGDSFNEVQITEIFSRNGIKLDKTGRYATIKVKDKASEADCIELLKVCYKSYME